jgi:hypothetical protein
MADAERCPELDGNAIQRAQRASADATDFVFDVREEEPRVVWGRVARFVEDHPQRAMAALVHLAAMVDPDDRMAIWAREFGGMPALHPDYRNHQDPAPSRRGGKVSAFREPVQTLATTTDLTDVQIAERVGCAAKTVARYRQQFGIHRQIGPDTDRTDAKVRPLIERGLTDAQIITETGFAKATVRYSRRRIEADALERAAPASDASAA